MELRKCQLLGEVNYVYVLENNKIYNLLVTLTKMFLLLSPSLSSSPHVSPLSGICLIGMNCEWLPGLALSYCIGRLTW